MMRTWAVVKFGEPLELIKVPLPALTGTEVLVKNIYAGVCHSDLHNWTNDFNQGTCPCTLGHEMEGELIALGPEVPKDILQLGKRYLVFPWIGCGSRPKPCKMCALGVEQCCVIGAPQRFCDGKSVYGGYSSHVVVPHPRYLIDSALASGVPEGLACTYMCSGLTVFSALKKIGKLPDGPESLLVLGCGGLGLQAIQFAKYIYGGLPRAADISPAARDAAAAMGCVVHDPKEPGIVKQIMKATRGGYSAVLDLVGSTETTSFAAGVVHNGGTIVFVGLFGGEIKLPTAWVAGTTKRLQGNLTGSLAEAHEMLQAVKAGAVKPIPYQLRDISDINQTFNDLKKGSIVGRCVLRHQDPQHSHL